MLRDMIRDGFNAAPGGGKVFDGAMPLMAGGGDAFPFTYGTATDPVSGRRDGIFARCSATAHLPEADPPRQQQRLLAVGRASLVATGGTGKRRRLARRRARLPDVLDPAHPTPTGRCRANAGTRTIRAQQSPLVRAHARPPGGVGAQWQGAAAEPLPQLWRRDADQRRPRLRRLPRPARARLSHSGRIARLPAAGADGGRGRPRHRRHPPARHRSAAGDARRLEPAPRGRARAGAAVRRRTACSVPFAATPARGRSAPRDLAALPEPDRIRQGGGASAARTCATRACCCRKTSTATSSARRRETRVP